MNQPTTAYSHLNGHGAHPSAHGTSRTRNAAADLAHLEQLAASLSSEYAVMRSQLAENAAAALSSATQSMPSGLVLPDSPAALAQELSAVSAAQQYLKYIQELQVLVRHVERLVRVAERSLQLSVGGEAPSKSDYRDLSNAVDAHSQAVGYVIALEDVSKQYGLDRSVLSEQGSVVSARAKAAAKDIRDICRSAAQRMLAACGWPPPLVSGAGEASARDSSPRWQGWEAAGHVALELQQLFIIQLTLQRASQHQQFAALPSSSTGEVVEDASAVLPVLWVGEELAGGVASWLSTHFAGGLATDRPDKPEWLFAGVLKAARQLSPQVEAFQPCIDAHGLQNDFTMAFEFVRGIHSAGLAPLLRAHVLPRLASIRDAPSWLHYVDEAIRFEKSFAPLRGVAALPDARQFDAAFNVAYATSAVEILFEKDEWADGWLIAELEEGVRQVESAAEAPDAWHSLAGEGIADVAMFDAASGGGGVMSSKRTSEQAAGASAIASQHEFFPPACAETVVSVIVGLAQRSICIHGMPSKARFAKTVVQGALKAFRKLLASMLSRAEQFDTLMDPRGLPKVGAALCAMHFVEHALQEPQGELLEIAAADDALTTIFEKEAADLATLRRQWAYKLAKLAVGEFETLFASYRRRSFQVFAAPSEDGDADVDATELPAPSAALTPAAERLETLIRALAASLDAIVFRDAWRAVAVAVNRAFFEDVATEATFSRQGAAQLESDLNTMLRVFVACTSRPSAYFKEAKDACTVLRLSPKEAALLRAAAQNDGRATDAAAVLQSAKIRALNMEQVSAVLCCRLD